MIHKATTQGEVGQDRTLIVHLPKDFPVGPVEVTVRKDSVPEDKKMTAAELAKSKFAGMWKDRTDLPTNEEEFAEWRRKPWERKAG